MQWYLLTKDNHVSHWKCAYPLLPVASPSQVVLGFAHLLASQIGSWLDLPTAFHF